MRIPQVITTTLVSLQIFMDGQSLLLSHPEGHKLLPTAVVDMGAWYANEFKDHLANPALAPVWFKSVLAAEVVLQLPFFFVALYAWLTKATWIRIPTIAYGAHVATTLVPIIGDFLFAQGGPVLFQNTQQRLTLVALYSPYFVIPLLLMWRAMARAHMFDPNMVAGPLQKKQKTA